MSYLYDRGVFRRLTEIESKEKGVCRVYKWPLGCAAIYIGLEDRPASVVPDVLWKAEEGRYSRVSMRFIGADDIVIGAYPVEYQQMVVVLREEHVEVARRFVPSIPFFQDSEVLTCRIEVRAPISLPYSVFSYSLTWDKEQG